MFDQKIFPPTFFWPNLFFSAKTFFYPKFFGQNNFWPKIFLGPNFFYPLILLGSKRMSTKFIFGQKNSNQNSFWESFFFLTKIILRPNIFLGFRICDLGYRIEDLGLGIWDQDSFWPTDPFDQLGVAQLSQIFAGFLKMLCLASWCKLRFTLFFCMNNLFGFREHGSEVSQRNSKAMQRE